MPEIKANEILQPNLYEIGRNREIIAAHWTEVKNSVGSTFNRADFTTLNAFFWSSLDLSIFAKRDTGYTPYKIQLIDSAGKKAAGYLGAVGPGETLGSEVLLNPSFDNNTQYWSSINGTIQSSHPAGGGQSDDYCILSATSGTTQYFSQQRTATLLGGLGALIKTTGYIKSGTSVDEAYSLRIHNGDFYLFQGAGVSSGSWIQITPGYFVVDSFWVAGIGAIYFHKDSSTIGTMLFDEPSLKRVTDPPSTAVHIVSSFNGTTRNWASKESGFNLNSIASWIIYHNDLMPA